jgi:hypothetical protein
MNGHVLYELVICDHLFELSLSHEMIMNPLNFTLSGVASGIGDAETNLVSMFTLEFFNERTFPSSRRSHDDKGLELVIISCEIAFLFVQVNILAKISLFFVQLGWLDVNSA